MAGGSSVALWRDLQTLFDAGTASGLSDRQLLEQFALRWDATAEAAFEVLVLRHGPMVWRVCRNALPDWNDAQDAFQATFLVLVRRCGSVRGLESLGGWLYGVACRVAARARVEAAKRRAAEGRAALRVVEAVESSAADDADREELRLIVQEEVRRLPEKYRVVVVLCYWEGCTQEQAAAALGCPLGTVRSRLARARELLRRRLTRRGRAPLAGLVAAGFEPASASTLRLPPIPPDLVQMTVRAAVQVVTGKVTVPVVSGAVASLVHRVLWSMIMIKISSVAAGVVLIGVVGYGVGLAAQRAGQPPSVRPTAGQAPQVQNKAGGQEPQVRHLNILGSKNVFSQVEGQAMIVRVLPDGARVKKGDVICALDSAALHDRLLNQRITTKSAEANYQNAKLDREVDQIAVREYVEGRFLRQKQDIEGEIRIAEAELALAQDELAKANHTQGELALKRLELNVLRARLALEKTQRRLSVLLDYTKTRKIKELEAAVERAHSTELAKQATWMLERAKEEKLERQVSACTIIAPIDGTLQYVHRPGNPLDPNLGQIDEGSIVRHRQLLFRIVAEDQPR